MITKPNKAAAKLIIVVAILVVSAGYLIYGGASRPVKVFQEMAVVDAKVGGDGGNSEEAGSGQGSDEASGQGSDFKDERSETHQEQPQQEGQQESGDPDSHGEESTVEIPETPTGPLHDVYNPDPPADSPDIFKDAQHPKYAQSLPGLIAYAEPLVLEAISKCEPSTSDPLTGVPCPNGGKQGCNDCRGVPVLSSSYGFTLKSLPLTPYDALSTGTWGHVVLYPCKTRESGNLENVHQLGLWSQLSGPAMFMPVASPHTIAGTPIWLLSILPPLPGVYTLQVRTRWMKDHIEYLQDPSHPNWSFLGESEARSINQEERTRPGGKDCVSASTLLSTRVIVSGSEPSGVLSLPLATHGLRAPNSYWRLIANNLEDCRNKDHSSYASGDPCKLADPSWADRPVYIYQPSDRRYHYFTTPEIKQCFAKRSLKNILVQGVSQAREAYMSMPIVLAGKQLDAEYGKELKARLHGSLAPGGTDEIAMDDLNFRYKQEWGETVDESIKFLRNEHTFDGGVDVLVYNGGIPAHKVAFNTEFSPKMQDAFEKTTGRAPIKFFLLSVSLQGMRNFMWTKMRMSAHVEDFSIFASELGFIPIDLEQMTMMWDVKSTAGEDGFHYGFNVEAMTSVIISNIICNGEDQSKVGKGIEVDINNPGFTFYTYREENKGEYKFKMGHPTGPEMSDPALMSLARFHDIRSVPYNAVDVYRRGYGVWRGEGRERRLTPEESVKKKEEIAGKTVLVFFTILLTTVDDALWLLPFLVSNELTGGQRFVHGLCFVASLQVVVAISALLAAMGKKTLQDFGIFSLDPEATLSVIAAALAWSVVLVLVIKKYRKDRSRRVGYEEVPSEDIQIQNEDAKTVRFSPRTVVACSLIGAVDELFYFPPLLLANPPLFGVPELSVGALIASTTVAVVVSLLLNQCRRFVEWCDSIEIAGFVGLFALSLTIEAVRDAMRKPEDVNITDDM